MKDCHVLSVLQTLLAHAFEQISPDTVISFPIFQTLNLFNGAFRQDQLSRRHVRPLLYLYSREVLGTNVREYIITTGQPSLQPVGIFNKFLFNLKYLFACFSVYN